METATRSRRASKSAQFEATEVRGYAPDGGGESNFERNGFEFISSTLRIKKRDEIGLTGRVSGSHLMNTQKQEILEFISNRNESERTVREVLRSFGVSPSSFYRWQREVVTGELLTQRLVVNPRTLTEYERQRILEVKSKNPALRHRRVQGELQKQGLYISASSCYKTLKKGGLIEPYARRECPWDEPRYEIRGRCMMWGADWTKLKINHVWWYLLTLIDFFSRKIVAWDIVGNVNAGHIKQLYSDGMDNENLPLNWEPKPELRADRGSPNTADVTKNFFKDIQADLSWARVRRPTDNAITERFYGTIKQEEIYVVGSYPDLQSAREEIGKYINFYNDERPHQAL